MTALLTNELTVPRTRLYCVTPALVVNPCCAVSPTAKSVETVGSRRDRVNFRLLSSGFRIRPNCLKSLLTSRLDDSEDTKDLDKMIFDAPSSSGTFEP